ncbi:MAG TPA: segregation/condensation protein A, partial [Solirubrobacterales bacterium]|nr:segregation/condensation protein A [Solirubrobacterales bacterium]
MASAVRDLELDLDAFEGPFDLLLTLVLKEQLEPAEIDVAAIVVAFVEHLTATERIDLDACGEFLVLVAALLEIKARQLFPDESAELSELEPEEAAAELARRLAEYRRMKEAAVWLRERLAEERDRYFRLGPAPLAPRAERRLAPQDPAALAMALAGLAEPPP